MSRQTIDRLRRTIDDIDDEMLRLLERRAEAAREIGRAKTKDGSVVWVPSREKKILDRLEKGRGALPPKAVRGVFREVISFCRGLEQNIRVAYLGPEATYTHMAAREQFGAGAELVPTASIPQVFDEVERGRAHFGVVPIENSTDGSVAYTLDRFLESPLQIAAELCLDVSHNLLSKSGDPKRVKRVVSHPQGIAQCRRWISARFPGVETIEMASTARAAEFASKTPDAAAIASRLAGEVYGLATIAESIQDLSFNATRFVVLSTTDSSKPSGDDKTSAVFAVRDEVGVLQRMLSPFGTNRINLTRIESRPFKGKPWEYVFFLDFLGHREEPRVKRALAKLDEVCTMLRVLGSYPVWR